MPFFAWITIPFVISGCHIQNLPVIQCSHSLTDLLTDCYQAYCLTGQLKKKWGSSYLVILVWLAVSVLFLLQVCPLQILICIHSITLPFTLNSWTFAENWGNTVHFWSHILSPMPSFLHNNNSCYFIICVEQRTFCCVWFKKSQEIHEVYVTQYSFWQFSLYIILVFSSTQLDLQPLSNVFLSFMKYKSMVKEK